MFSRTTYRFANYFKLGKKPTSPLNSINLPLLWIKRLSIPIAGTLTYAYFFNKNKKEEQDQTQKMMRSDDISKIVKNVQPKRTIWGSIWSGIIHALRFMQLLIIFSPLIVLSPLLWFQKTRGFWQDCFVKAVERSGVVFIKAFQYLSHRRDIIGPQLADKFEYLREQAPTHTFQTTKNYFRDAYGRTIEQIFDQFDPTPIASGSVSQVYKAIYKGQKVAVKVRHPNVDKYIERDINLLFFLSYLSSFISPAMDIPISRDSLKKTLSQQMDFTFEMRNLNKFKWMFRGRKDVEFPSPFQQNTKDSVLIQSFIEGRPITYFQAHKHPLNKVIAKLGSEVLFEMLMKNNFVHADCHGGNIFISTEQKPYNFFTEVWDFIKDIWEVTQYRIKAETLGEQRIKQVYLQYCKEELAVRKLIRTEKQKITINLIDAGMVVQLNEVDKQNFSRFIKSVVECRGDDCAEMIFSLSNYEGVKITQKRQKFNSYHKELTECFSRLNNSTYSQLEGMALLWDMMRIIRENKMKLDGQFATLLTNIIVLQSIGRSLDPDINILKCAFPYFKYIDDGQKTPLNRVNDLNVEVI